MTGDLVLRPVERADVSAFFEHQLEPEALAMGMFRSRDREAFFAHWEKIFAENTSVTRTVCVDNVVAGNIVSWPQDGRWLVGYWIGRAFWGRGVATCALALFLPLVNARPLFAFVADVNIGSIRVLEKCGFKRTSTQSMQAPDGTPAVEHLYELQ